MKPHLFNLCPESASYIPKHGKSAFVRACIIDMGRRMNKSKGTPAPVEHVVAPPFTPASVEPVEPLPVAVEPVAWKRTWHRPRRDLPDGFDMTTLIWDKARRVFLNPPPWPACPQLDMEQARSWSLYVDQWTFPDPFPGPLEWHAMGEPVEPLPEHRAIAEPEAVEPLPVEPPAPSQESPPPGAALPVVAIAESPPAVAGASSLNILEDV